MSASTSRREFESSVLDAASLIVATYEDRFIALLAKDPSLVAEIDTSIVAVPWKP